MSIRATAQGRWPLPQDGGLAPVSDAWRDCASDLDVPAMSHCVVLHGGYGMRFHPHGLQSRSFSEVATGHVRLIRQVDNANR